ncbi:anti-sigma factor family protein [Nocardioides antri]|uniref:Anti-sigma factor n=1 Tax=Nocardioides antri TaxID=2607659 RepID=A0A5B1M8H9_9ACTN|nr:zf-HC2 domain-containing protein [Nocardioides antri]KAA1428197.1 anti-sigma factor [Nocardioides antri]
MSCPYATLDAAYVLGSLSPTERADYERHLADCEECARAVRELAGMPGLLAKVPAEVLEPSDAVPVPETLLPRLVAAVRRDQRWRTTRAALGAAAAVAVIAGGSVAALVALDGDETPAASPPVTVTAPTTAPSTAPSEQLDPVGSSRSTGWVSLTEVPWGTRLDLTCVYDAPYGYAEDRVYTLVVETTDGRVEKVASFQALPGEEMHVTGATAVGPDAIAAVEVRTSDGDAVLRLDQ